MTADCNAASAAPAPWKWPRRACQGSFSREI